MTNRMFATFLSLSAMALPANAQDSGEWIVIGSDAAGVAQGRLAENLSIDEPQPMFEVHRDRSGLTVARIDERMSSVLNETMHENFRRCGGYTVHPSLEEALREQSNPIYRPGHIFEEGDFSEPLSEQASVKPALDKVDAARIVSVMSSLERLGNRYYQSAQGATAADTVAELWRQYGAGRGDFAVEKVSHNWSQPSVVATIRGTEYPDEIIVLGGHLDSINQSSPDDAPGADDNASGIAVVSEVLKVLAETGFKPKRTISFFAYAAEEVGLRGSGELAASYQADGRKVKGVIQFDMTGFAGSEKNMYFVTDYVNPYATGYLKRLITEYNSGGPHIITWGETQCGYACSDHASWTARGFPSAFPFETKFSEYNRAIHSSQDLVLNLDSTGQHQVRFAKLGIEFAMELAKSADTESSSGEPTGPSPARSFSR